MRSKSHQKKTFTIPELIEYGRLEEIVLGEGNNCQGDPQGDPPDWAKQAPFPDCIQDWGSS